MTCMQIRVLRWLVTSILVALLVVIGLGLLEPMFDRLPLEPAAVHDLGHVLVALLITLATLGVPCALVGVLAELHLCIRRGRLSPRLILPGATLALTLSIAAAWWRDAQRASGVAGPRHAQEMPRQGTGDEGAGFENF
jgi:hypothetical protein